MIAILDYDMGNVAAIKNILKSINVNDTIITNNYDDIKKAEKIILPGVGAFDAGMSNLKKYDLVGPIIEAKDCGKHILGICMGMQLLGTASEEGTMEGLSLIPFSCKKFIHDGEHKVPHMGWDYVKKTSENNSILCGLGDELRYYFCHSYYAKCQSIENELLSCDYGVQFSAAVCDGNVYGVQFHPEKSHRYGKELFKRFAEL